MRFIIITAGLRARLAAGCQESSDLLRPPPTASPESLVVQGTVRTVASLIIW